MALQEQVARCNARFFLLMWGILRNLSPVAASAPSPHPTSKASTQADVDVQVDILKDES